MEFKDLEVLGVKYFSDRKRLIGQYTPYISLLLTVLLFTVALKDFLNE